MSRSRRFQPRIRGVRLSAIFDLYVWHLRRHAVQELLAGGGIAIGVALTFGVLIANTSITGTAGQLVHGIVGSARLSLSTRSSHGASEHLVEQVAKLPGVQVASPILRENVEIVGPKGRQLVQVIGVTPSLIALGSSVTRNLGAGVLLLSGGIGLPSELAEKLGVQADQKVTVLSNGDGRTANVRAVLGNQTIGAISTSPIAVALLPVAQRLTERPGRVTQILIRPRAGMDQRVTAELRSVAGGRLDVQSADNELNLLHQTAKPNEQSTGLFAALSAMVGFLLALNAMLLTIPERRRLVAELRTLGYAPGQVLVIVGFQALVLGLFASIVGVALGDVLSLTLFHEVPSYLTFAFPIGSHQVIDLVTILEAVGCGVFAAALATLPPIIHDLRPRRPLDTLTRETGETGQNIGRTQTVWLASIGAALILAVTGLVLIAPGLTILGGIMLALAALCLIPLAFTLVTRALGRLSDPLHHSMLAVAVLELRATATRSIALAGIAALAVFGSVAVRGARADLTHGLDTAIEQYLGTADIWVTTGDNVFTTDSFRADDAVARVARSSDVASARVYQGGLLDVGSRRLWIRARPSDDPAILQSSQMLHGDIIEATQKIREGGWAAISQGFATEHHLQVGDSFGLPTPSGSARLGVAAITTNTGWPSGAITLNAVEYQRDWETADPSAVEVNLRHGVTPEEGQRAVQRAIGYRPGLTVQTRANREAQFKANARQALRSLGEISTLLLIAAALAVASALSAAIWQRRLRLATLKTEGFDEWQLWRSLLLESVIVLAIGCIDGLILGFYGHALASRWLQLSTGFPAPFAFGWLQILTTLGLLSGIALAVVALPGLRAARVPTTASFQE
jgi:putative ABC transport system permease protein